MYLEFKLPNGAAGQAAAFANRILTQELHAWSDKYKIPYNSKIFKYTKRVTFDDDATYSFFAMTWNPSTKQFRSYLVDYSLIEPMDTRDK